MEPLNVPSDEIEKAITDVIKRMAADLLNDSAVASNTASPASSGSDIMADLQKVYDWINNQPRYEVWVSKSLNDIDDKNGLILDCRDVKAVMPNLPDTTHIVMIPEKWLSETEIEFELMAARLPVFDMAGNRITLIEPLSEAEVVEIERQYQADVEAGKIQPHRGEPPEWFRKMVNQLNLDL